MTYNSRQTCTFNVQKYANILYSYNTKAKNDII
jgi:hypothetical protein